MGYLVLCRVLVIVSGQGSVYDCGSFVIKLRKMSGVFVPSSFVNASRRMWSIFGCSIVERAFSYATIYFFSLGLRLWSGAVEIGCNGMDVSF